MSAARQSLRPRSALRPAHPSSAPPAARIGGRPDQKTAIGEKAEDRERQRCYTSRLSLEPSGHDPAEDNRSGDRDDRTDGEERSRLVLLGAVAKRAERGACGRNPDRPDRDGSYRPLQPASVACGFLLKDAPEERLLTAIQVVAEGRLALRPVGHPAPDRRVLTPRPRRSPARARRAHRPRARGAAPPRRGALERRDRRATSWSASTP